MVDNKPEKNKPQTSHQSRRNSPGSLHIPSRSSPRNISPLVHCSSQKRLKSPSSPTIGSPCSPLATTLSPCSDIDSEKKKKKSTKKSVCPCGMSSTGRDWLLLCGSCKQTWHSSCANLKGTNGLSQNHIDAILEHWLCPWCFQCSFSPPDNHPAVLNSSTLLNNTISCSVLQQISDSVSDVVAKSLPKSLTTQINELSHQVQQVHDLSKKPVSVEAADETPKIYRVTPEPPYQHYCEEYLEEPLLSETINFLKEQVELKRFTSENGHSVLSFGEPYTYVGAKGENNSTTIPPLLMSIIQSFSTKLRLKHTPNSVLINHYTSTSVSPNLDNEDVNSYLPFHSDDEAVIQPDSSIVTISLGESRTLTFQAIHNDTEEQKTLTPSHNSVYTMTRSSQGWYKHGIQPAESSEDRFSLTFRCVSQKNKRSVIIQGDSNTKNIKFGTGLGTVGETYPGLRRKAAKVSDITPESCIGYSNAVLVCGTNDLRVGYVRDESDIRKIVDVYKFKLQEIKQLCPSCKVFVVPVLPTRNTRMNKNIVCFNRMLSEMLNQMCFKDVFFPGVYSFLDSKGLLSSRLTRENDDIHLSEKGLAQFVRIIKLWIFECEARERRFRLNSSRVPGRQFGPPRPN